MLILNYFFKAVNLVRNNLEDGKRGGNLMKQVLALNRVILKQKSYKRTLNYALYHNYLAKKSNDSMFVRYKPYKLQRIQLNAF